MRTLSAKKWAVGVLCAVMLVSLAVSAGMRPRAEGFTPAAPVMQAGAGVRIDESENGNNGIRYTMTVAKEEYEAILAAEESGAEVSFGILLAPADYHAENPLNEANVFGENAVYDWAVKNPETGEWEYTEGGGKTRIMHFVTDYLAWNEDLGAYAFSGSIVKILTENLNREFFATAYTKVTENGEESYYFAAENDNARSAAYLAQMAIADTSATAPTPEQKNWLQENYVDAVTDKAETYTVEVYLEQEAGVYELSEEKTFTAEGTLDQTVTAEVKTFSGYAFDGDNDLNVTEGKALANGKLTLKLYYNRYVAGGNPVDFTLPTSAYDLASAGFIVENAAGEEVTEGVTWQVFNAEGTEVSAAEGKYDLSAAGVYTASAILPQGKVEGYTIYVKEFAQAADGRLIYMDDLAVTENDKWMVTPDFAGAKVGSSLGGHNTAVRGWQKVYNLIPAISEWGYTFNADVDTSAGAIVSFDACLCAWDNNYCNITLTRADGSEEFLAKQPADYNRHTYSFTLAVNEPLAGCKLTFNCSHNGITHVFGKIYIDTSLRAGKTFALAQPTAAYDLADAGFAVQNAAGEEITEGVTWQVFNAEGTEVAPAEGKYDLSTAGVYTVKAAIADKEFVYTLYVKTFAYDDQGRFKYMDDLANCPNDEVMFTPDFSSATIAGALGGYGSAEKGWSKPWSPAFASWGYTFNAEIDNKNGAVVTFTDCMHDDKGISWTITLTRADGKQEVLATYTTDYRPHTTSFTLAAGESLAGCKLTFSCTNSTLGHTFGKVVIEYL